MSKPVQSLASRSFHHRDFASDASLLAIKQAQGLRIAAVVPTLNEAATVSAIVSVLCTSPLLDRVLVIDSDSTDNTMDLAKQAGAEVVQASSLRPELPPARGKGENLWKSLDALPEIDLFLFIDGDLRQFSARFIRGLLGPLLSRPDLHFIKADYDRPGGGGRVTELLVRPLFRQFFAELATLGQPLSGEYAARRQVLESIPFPVGYGVEAAHLIDISRQWGHAAIGQCHLGRRLHRNRPLSDLALMSDAIVQTILSRLDLAPAGFERPARKST